MMINKRLTGMVSESKPYIAANVALQWCALAANIAMMAAISLLIAGLYHRTTEPAQLAYTALIALLALCIRYLCTTAASRMSFLSSAAVKRILRERIMRKLLRLGIGYQQQVNTSEVVQVAVEGVDQLETYFGSYLPQFFYALLAPVTLFIAVCFVNVPAAAALLACVPLIPGAIAAVQTWAKKLLSKYWGAYTSLGDTFLENLQGLTTLKIYQADEFKSREMDREAEAFRKITMKVLSMQLNSITIMDLVAYGGSALGILIALGQFRQGALSLAGCLLILLLSADFFIPMRLLGSYFHIAMNGMAASDKIFRLLDLPEPEAGTAGVPADMTISCQDLTYAYEEGRPVLHHVDMVFPQGSLTALVGESGCGKSTLAAIIMGRNKDYQGSVALGGVELSALREDALMNAVTYVGHQSYLFKGTVRDNLRMGNPHASDEQLWEALERVRLAAFLRREQGLDTPLLEKGSNLSGGQCQRLVLARALLHDTPVYIFDEAASNIDVESENRIMALIRELSQRKTVILISHRLANVVTADTIYVLRQGTVAERGDHNRLLSQKGVYETLWRVQQDLEHFGGNGV